MRHVSYVFLRRDTGSYFFRWTVPANVRPFLGGRTEIKKSLHTDQRRDAIRLARRLSVLLERATGQLMYEQLRQRQESPCFYLTFNLIERLVDGTIRMEGVQIDPANAEDDQRILAGLLGTAIAAPIVPRDKRTLSDLVAAYFSDGERGKKWTAKTRQELANIFALLVEILGPGKQLAELSRKDFAYVKEVLGKLPSNRSKNPRYRDKSISELLAFPIPTEDLLSATTINKNLGWASALLGWGQLHGYVPANFAEGLALAKTCRDDECRQPYTDDEVTTLLNGLCDQTQGFPWRKWVPLLLLYQGMRVNEAAQLRLEDFGEVEGIPVVTITDEGGGRLKTSSLQKRGWRLRFGMVQEKRKLANTGESLGRMKQPTACGLTLFE